MNEISLHILDILQNSIHAGASLITVIIRYDQAAGTLSISIEDDGCGMDEAYLEKVTNPFVTGRTTRRVGLGIPLFKAGAEGCGGSFEIKSQKGRGTLVSAVFITGNIDCPPLGNMTDTLVSQVISHQNVDFIYKFITNAGEMNFDTREIKGALAGVPLDAPEIISWMRQSINEEINEIGGGKVL